MGDARVTTLQEAGYDSANICDRACMPPPSVAHQVGTCRPDFMLPEGRLLLFRHVIHFLLAPFQELKTRCPIATGVTSGDIFCCHLWSTVDAVVLELLRF